MRPVDAHVHLWTRATDPQDWIDPATMAPIDRDFLVADLQEMLDESRCRTAVVVQSLNSLDESRRLLALDGPVAGVVGWVDLTGDVRAQLDRLRTDARSRLVGIRHLAHVDPDPSWLGRDDVSAAMKVLAEEGLAFDLVLRRSQLPLAASLARAHPDVRFVLDHLGDAPAPGGDLVEWREGIAALAALPHVSAKLSGLSSWLAPGWAASDLEPVVAAAFDAFGPGRLLYGSDWPLVRMGGGAASWRDAAESLVAAFAPHDVERVFETNAVEVYGLA